MRKNIAILATATLLAAAAGAWFWQAHQSPRGNIAHALTVDLSPMDDTQLLSFIEGLQFDGSTSEQRLALFDRVKARFDSFAVTQKLSLLLAARKLFDSLPQSLMMRNSRVLMQEYWNRELKTYMQAGPEERVKLLDARIDEAVMYENLQKVQDVAKSLFGKGGEPNADEVRHIQEQIAHAIVESMQTRLPNERAAASQYFLEMRERRLKRGIPVLF